MVFALALILLVTPPTVAALVADMVSLTALLSPSSSLPSSPLSSTSSSLRSSRSSLQQEEACKNAGVDPGVGGGFGYSG